MLDAFAPHIAGAIVVAIFGLFTYLVRSFFSRIEGSLKELKGAVDKLEGRFDSIQTDVRANTVEMAVARNELRAVWRFIDNAPRRASDFNGGGE